MAAPQRGSRPGASASRPPFALLATFVVLVLTSALSSCGPRVSLGNTHDSPTAVASAVIEALNRRDLAALERLAVSEEEFRYLVWPKQPAARPGRNIPWDYAWKDLAGKSRLQMRGRAHQWPAERGFTLVDVSFGGDTTDYETYRIYRESRVTLRDRQGEITTTRVFGSMIEERGHFKVFSYVVD